MLLAFFGQKLVGTERIVGEYGPVIDRADRLRTSAEYMMLVTTEAEAGWAVDCAETFLYTVRDLLQGS